MTKKKKKVRVGSSFDDFLRQEGIYEEVTARAIKRVIARQLNGSSGEVARRRGVRGRRRPLRASSAS